MSDQVLPRIRQLLNDNGCPFREIEHAATFTSEESARARGEELGVGAKALLLRTDDVFRLFVLPADRKLDSAALKRELNVKRIRFATPEELAELTGLVPGSVPPFGQPVLPFELFADTEVGVRHGKVAFNAGSLTVSIVMRGPDWQTVAAPMRFAFGKAAG
ncbi:MAG TPA: YbaK/EbsC family protein [Pirellulales bacterium]|nr:YbaK/EbsC family protein [Pirellulales bacterium]